MANTEHFIRCILTHTQKALLLRALAVYAGAKHAEGDSNLFAFSRESLVAADEARQLSKQLARTPATPATTHYLLAIRGDVEAEVLGPFETPELRDQAAKAERAKDGNREDGLHRLDISLSGTLTVSDYSGQELDDDTDEPV